MAAVITAIGMLPGTEFYFNLHGGTYRIDKPEVLEHYYKQRSFTATEFVTIMNNPLLRAKTTFYLQNENGTYRKGVKPNELPKNLRR